MLRYLKEASPWLMFIGVMGFICCGFMALLAIIMFAAGPAMSEAFSSIETFGAFNYSIGMIFGGMMGVLFLVFAVIGFFPSFFVYNFGIKIRAYFQRGAEQELELAFKNNKSLWKFIGILAIIQLASMFLPIVLGIIVAIIAAIAGG
jgi:magnesium-transporting ATPase (P-type)